ncbi:hypothetical protein [Mongoliitalea daihaiensis]|uniref:hypothetical protein n=1 Tax=Mongoliitalea daihaiensis TaxID=2782006 RepID=UPI001F379DD0|nr:hypothetical protein [Mongoliitalea daihaiensis]UJP63998.1 hypothetical protein IPZ59_14365 [Mongoliitalea daihaiensis]
MKDIRIDDIMPRLKALHPNMPEKKIREIVIKGCAEMTAQTKKRKDITIVSRKNGIHFTIYKPHSNKEK